MATRNGRTSDILHLSTQKHFRGGERQVRWLHEGLLERGVGSVLACKSGGDMARAKAAGSIGLRWAGLWDIVGLGRLIGLCRRVGPSIIHSHDSYGFTLASIAGAVLRIPVVHTRRVVYDIRRTAFNRWKYGHAAGIVAVSSAVAQLCAQIAPGLRLAVVHDGVRWDGPQLPRPESRSALGLPNDAFVIGIVGYFTREKNLQLVFHLARKLMSEAPHVRIAVIGPMKSSLGRRTRDFGNITAPGAIPDAVRYYGAFDAYVSTSTREGLGTALLDAVVRDIPAVALDSGGSRDIFATSRSSVVGTVREDDFITAVKQVVQHYDRAAEAARVLRTWARSEFCVENMIEGNLELYRSIVPSLGRDRPAQAPGAAE